MVFRPCHGYCMGRKRAARSLGRNSIRAWRGHRNLTLARLADRVRELGVTITDASLSRIERGQQPYSQSILEALAEALRCEPADLVMRHPEESDEIRLVSMIRELGESERKQALKILRALSAA